VLQLFTNLPLVAIAHQFKTGVAVEKGTKAKSFSTTTPV
jgi:hypothetical protein